VVPAAWEVAHPAAADKYDAVFLQVVADARDVGRRLDAICQAHPGDLAQRGIRLLWRNGFDNRAHSTLLRAVYVDWAHLKRIKAFLQYRGFGFVCFFFPAFSYQLVECRQ